MAMTARERLFERWYVPVYTRYGYGYVIPGICTWQSYICIPAIKTVSLYAMRRVSVGPLGGWHGHHNTAPRQQVELRGPPTTAHVDVPSATAHHRSSAHQVQGGSAAFPRTPLRNHVAVRSISSALLSIVPTTSARRKHRQRLYHFQYHQQRHNHLFPTNRRHQRCCQTIARGDEHRIIAVATHRFVGKPHRMRKCAIGSPGLT